MNKEKALKNQGLEFREDIMQERGQLNNGKEIHHEENNRFS